MLLFIVWKLYSGYGFVSYHCSILALAQNGVNAEEIDYIIGTHGHSDHIGNLNLFPKATHIICYDINKGNIYHCHPFHEVRVYTVISVTGHLR